MAGNDVRVDVELDSKKAEAEAESFKGKMGKIFGDISKIAGGVALGAGITNAAGFLKDAAQAAAEDEAATKRLEQALRNAGGAFDENKKKIDARIESGAKLAYSDDAVRDSFQQLLAATGDVDEALRRQALAMDFARGAGIPLEQASKLLGKVTEENVEQFKRLGINIGEGATEAEAFAVIQGKFAGQAETYAKSTAGQFEQTKIRMGELKEQIGTALLPAMTAIGNVLVTQVIPKLEEFAAYWQTNIQPKINQFIEWFQTNVMPVIEREFKKFQKYFDSDIKPALENIQTAIQETVQFIMEHWGKIEPFVRPIFIAIELAFKTMVNAIGILIDILGGDWDGAVQGIKQIWDDTVNALDDTFNAVKDQILVAVGLLTDGFKGIAGAIEGAFAAAIGAIIGLINKAIEAYNKIPLAPNVSTIGTGSGSSSTSTTGGPVPGGENDQMPGREVFGLNLDYEPPANPTPMQYIGGGRSVDADPGDLQVGDYLPGYGYKTDYGWAQSPAAQYIPEDYNQRIYGRKSVTVHIGTVNVRDESEARLEKGNLALYLAAAGVS